MKQFASLTGALLIGGLLAGCAGAASDPPSPDSPSPSPAAADDQASPPAATSPGPTESAPAPSPTQVASGPSCLHGTWLADNEYFLATLKDYSAGASAESVTGKVYVSFDADGTMKTDYRGWTIDVSYEGNETKIRRDGVNTGTYSTTNDSLDFAEKKVGSTMTLTVAGVDMAITPEPATQIGANYTCTATAAAIEANDATLKLTRQDAAED